MLTTAVLLHVRVVANVSLFLLCVQTVVGEQGDVFIFSRAEDISASGLTPSLY